MIKRQPPSKRAALSSDLNASFLMTLTVVAAWGCGPTAPGRPQTLPVPQDRVGLVVENHGNVDVIAFVVHFGDQRRRLGIVPAGTVRDYTFPHVDQDLFIGLAAMSSETLGQLPAIFTSPYLDNDAAGEAYYVNVPPSGPIVFAKGGPPQKRKVGGVEVVPLIVVGALGVLVYHGLNGMLKR